MPLSSPVVDREGRGVCYLLTAAGQGEGGGAVVLGTSVDDSVVKAEVAGSSPKCLFVLTFSTHFSENTMTLLHFHIS